MRKDLQNVIKTHLRAELLHRRSSLHFTQEKMAEYLHISVRAYVDLESGKSACSLITYLLFLQNCTESATVALQETLALLPAKNAEKQPEEES